MDKREKLPVLKPEEIIELSSELSLISDHPDYHAADYLWTHIGDTVKLRIPKVTVDELGRNVWADEVAECSFELEAPEVATDPYNQLKFEKY